MKASKNGLFLMEMILVVLLFSLAAAICLQMFGYANKTAQKAQDLSHGTLVARSAISIYQATNGDLEAVASMLSGTVQEETVIVAYDDQWEETKGQGTYVLRLTAQDYKATATVEKPGDTTPIFTLEGRIIGGAAS